MNQSHSVICACFSAIILCLSCNNGTNSGANTDPTVTAPSSDVIAYSVVSALPHDTNAFTEGLLIHDGQLFESTGHTESFPNSRSLFGQVDPHSGKILTKAEIDSSKYFGEGIVFLRDKVYQLTLSTHIGFLYDAKSYKRLGEFHYEGDGWGLTTNGSELIMSNGTSDISYRDPVTFRIVRTLGVTDNNGPVSNINELELIKGFLYANHWLTNNILKIDTATGKVVGRLDLASLKSDALSKFPESQEMNGIAYDAGTDRIFVTGKFWPAIYEIKFSH